MKRPRFLGTLNIGGAFVGALIFAMSTLLLFGFILWQTAGYETGRTDVFLRHEAEAIARESATQIVPDVNARFANDLHRKSFAAVFTAGGQPLAGDPSALPAGLMLDGQAHAAIVARNAGGHSVPEPVRLVGRQLPDGRILLVGRSADELSQLHRVIWRALALGLVPGVILAITAGILSSLRAFADVQVMKIALERIMRGQLTARLPVRNAADTLGGLAISVNRMLDEIEHLVGEIRAAGDGIAHDLRTPLGRARARLENGRAHATSQTDLDNIVDAAIADLDQCATIVTALLRISEIDSTQRRAGFGDVALAPILVELADLYQPVAELRNITLTLDLPATNHLVRADRDLLFEAMANLVDNAVKFVPAGGKVQLSIEGRANGPVMWITDSGEGIAVAERAAVLQRFHRADRTRAVPGCGLGLSLVAAILRLHGFELLMQSEALGFSVGVWCLADSGK
jgi:signal transduction histidine kinase